MTVTLLCFVRPEDRPSDLEELASYCRAVEPVPITRSRLGIFVTAPSAWCPRRHS